MPSASASGITPAETALYTHDMLESLRKIAVRQEHHLLAHLLELAALEAKAIGNHDGQETSLPA